MPAVQQLSLDDRPRARERPRRRAVLQELLRARVWPRRHRWETVECLVVTRCNENVHEYDAAVLKV
jgi:hypothetical protein